MTRFNAMLASFLTVVLPPAFANAAAPPVAAARAHGRRDAVGTATVSLAVPSGTPSQMASGFIYGLPDSPDGSANESIPWDLRAGMGFNYNRAGGAQLPTPSLGWIAGELEGRWLSTLSNYRTTRESGGRFQLLLHDLWGADGGQGSDAEYPGDDGDWTSYDAFLSEIISGINSANMLEGLDIDLWNEPDGGYFWGATRDQYLAMWQRGYETFRSQLPSVLLIGPSTAFSPDTSVGADFWVSWANYTASTDTIPDILTFHLLDTSVSLRSAKVAMDAFRETYGIPELPIVVNEYGSLDNEQVPSGAAWYIGQFERYNVHGLRANWAGGVNGSELHDFLGNLLGKTVNETGEYYYPAMEWPVYHYYATEMRDERVATSSSSDDIFEVFATSGGAVGAIKILAAERPKGNHQTYDITVTGLSAVGISGSVNIQTYRFNGADWREQVGGPDDLGIVAHDVTNDSVTFWVTPDTNETAYVFEFV